MSCLICNELLHDTITCGLIPVYLTLNTISPPKVVTQLPKPNKDLSGVLKGARAERLSGRRDVWEGKVLPELLGVRCCLPR
jgi:hypothetical protein